MENPMIAVHQAGDQGNGLWWTVYDGKSWSVDMPLPQAQAGSPPAGVVFQNRLFVLYQSGDGDNSLVYTAFDGFSWSQPALVPGAATATTPSAVVLDDHLFCFYQGGSGAIYYNVFDGLTWSSAIQIRATTSGAPSAAVLGQSIYVFHPDGGGLGQLWFSVFNGLSWTADTQVPVAVMTGNPSAVVSGQGKELRVFFQGQNGDGTLFFITLSGNSWVQSQVPNISMSGSPGGGARGDVLIAAYQDASTAGLFFTTSEDGGATWSAGAQVPNVGTTSGPQLAAVPF